MAEKKSIDELLGEGKSAPKLPTSKPKGKRSIEEFLGGSSVADAYIDRAVGVRLDESGRQALARRGDSFWGKAGKVGGSALVGAVKVLDAPRALIDKTPVGDVADVLRDDNPKGVLGFLRNTVVDVAEDPLTYLTLGTSAAAKAGLKTVAKEVGEDVAQEIAAKGTKALTTEARDRVAKAIASEGGDVAAANVLRALDRGAQGGVKVAGRTVLPPSTLSSVVAPLAKARTSALDTTLADALVPRAAVKARQGGAAADLLDTARVHARASAGTRSEEIVRRLDKAARAAKVTPEELKRIVLPAIDIDGDSVDVPERLLPLVDLLRDVRQTATDRQLAEGLLPQVRDTETYVPLRLAKEGKRAIHRDPAVAERYLGAAPSELRAAVRQGGSLETRTLMPDAPILEVEEKLGGALKKKGLLGERDELVEKNPLTLIARRAAVAERAIAEKQFLDELADTPLPGGDTILQRAGEGVKRPAGWVDFDVPNVGKFFAPPEVADEVVRVRDVITNDDALREFQGLLGHLNTLWKGYATVPLVGGVGFHARNSMGNLWNNFLAGVKNPADYARAVKIQTALRKGKDNISPQDRRIVDLAEREGILDSGFYLAELTSPRHQGGRLARSAKGQKLAAGTINPLSTENAVIRSGRAVGSAVESNARLAHFIAKLRELGSAEEAARSVRRYLFDYSDLTPTERNLKKVAAFYTFMRKNTPLQFSEAARQPGKFAGLAHVYKNAAEQAPGADAPPWAIRDGLIPITDDFMVGVDLPATAALETLEPRLDNVINRFGGFLPSLAKLAAETKTQKSLFTGGKPQGSGVEQALDALFPLYGKVKRAPYTAAATGDDQTLARLLSAVAGLRARRLPEVRGR